MQRRGRNVIPVAMIVNLAGIRPTMQRVIYAVPSAWIVLLGAVVYLSEARLGEGLTAGASGSSWAQDNCAVLGWKSARIDGSNICCSTDDNDLVAPFTLSSCTQACDASWASKKCNAKGHICVSTKGSDKCCHPDSLSPLDGTLDYGKCEPVCHFGSALCEDPHMDGLRGQSIEWSGEDGGWYALIQDKEVGLQINVRVTAPLPQDFPNRQLVTGVSVLFDEHSFVVEVNSPYSTETSGCPVGVGPCLASGSLAMAIDGERPAALLGFLDGAHFHNGLTLSATNVPVECGQFGGGRIWAATYEEMIQGHRTLIGESFEEWVLKFRDMAAPDWCAKYVSERGLADVHSTHAVLRIETPLASVRVSVGPNYQSGGKEDPEGRVISDLDFWQMDVGLEGLCVGDSLSGILGETARPVLDDTGEAVMSGPGAFRGTVEDYRVSGALGVEFSLDRDT